MAPILQQGLSQAGVICTYPQALVHGPLQYGGLDIPQLYTEQMHHSMCVDSVAIWSRPRGPCQQLATATGEAIQLEVGYSGELLAAPLQLQDHVTDSWIKHVWISTQQCGVMVLTDFIDYIPQ